MFEFTQKSKLLMNTSNITNYKLKDFAELLGVSVKTLQRWDRDGTLKANRTPTDRRYYTYDQYLQFKGINTEDDQRQVVIYARVSTRNQKDDLHAVYGAQRSLFRFRTAAFRNITVVLQQSSMQVNGKGLSRHECPIDFISDC